MVRSQILILTIVRESRNRLLVRNQMRRWCSGHSFICSCRSAFWTQKVQANVDYLPLSLRRKETRQVHFARPPNRAPEPALSASSLTEKRRADALHAAFCQQPRLRAKDHDCCRMYSRKMYVATHDTRWVRCPTATCSLAAERRGECVRAS